MGVGRAADPGRHVVGGHGPALRLENVDLPGLDQLLEGRAFQRIVGDLAATGQPEVQGLASGERDAERSVCLVDNDFNGRISRA